MHGESLLTQNFKSQSISLILRNENNYLINSNNLHLESSYLLSKLMGNSLQLPFKGYITANNSYFAALALDKTILKIKPPTLEQPEKWRIIHYSMEGKKLLDDIVPAKETFEYSLNPYELIFVISLFN